MLAPSRAALSSLSARLGGASRAALATRSTKTTAGYGNADDAPGPGAGGETGGTVAAHPAPPLPHREASVDEEREREERRRHARGGSDPGIDEEKMVSDPGAERGPLEKSLHSAKGRIKEAVGESFFFLCWRRRREDDDGEKRKNSTPTLF